MPSSLKGGTFTSVEYAAQRPAMKNFQTTADMKTNDCIRKLEMNIENKLAADFNGTLNQNMFYNHDAKAFIAKTVPS